MKRPEPLTGLLCGLLLWLLAAPAWAAGFLTELAWLEDPGGQMGLAQAQAAGGWQTLERSVFTQGFSKSAFWFRLHIDPGDRVTPEQAAGNLIVRIQPIFHDDIRLFDPLDTAGKLRVTGDLYPWGNDESRLRDLNFLIPRGNAPRDIWLRLQTHNSTLAAFDVSDERSSGLAERRMDVSILLYCSVLFICMGWGIFNWLQSRDTLAGIYVLRELTATIYGLIYFGYLRISLSDVVMAAGYDFEALSNVLVWLHISLAMWFDWCLLRECRPWRRLSFLFGLLPWALLVEVGLTLAGKIDIAILVGNFTVVAAVLLALPLALTGAAWRDPDPSRRPPFPKALVVGVYALVDFAVLVQRIAAIGWWPFDNQWVIYIQFIYPLCTALIMMVMLKVRSNAMFARSQQMQARLALAQQQAEQQRLLRIEQANFLQMLAHELKTPLSVLRMTLGTWPDSGKHHRLAERAIADMDRVIEYLVEAERLADREIAVDHHRVNPGALLNALLERLPDSAQVVVADPARLADQDIVTDGKFVHMIISNLLDNALKYGAAGAPVQLAWYAENRAGRECLVLAVSNAVGSAGRPDPAQVFTKYYRAARAHESTGSGLGLYLSSTLAELLGGELRLQDGESDRVTFKLMLPAEQDGTSGCHGES